ncbi:hypothetical protein Agub_g7081 [Astrephomene gubernaculifera]|uniref:Uncharacterized protein n=1 Tax=Astrephomene gubernaculifera TaxID=47775 RepID=A0AAD3DS49_9CHLO|nr:hypothetical protein Agub_g7081 [Astrephomene gubernaculifera]
MPHVKELTSSLDADGIAQNVRKACRLAPDVASTAPCMEDLAKDLQSHDADALELTQLFRALEDTLAIFEAEYDSREEQALLGRAASVLDEAASDFVFRSGKLCSIGSLQDRAVYNELTPEQMQRWQQFKVYMSAQGWNITDLVYKAGELSNLMWYPLEHGSQRQQEVTPVMFEDWVDKYYHCDEAMRKLIKLISKFALPDKPLCRNPDSRKILLDEINNMP